MTQFVAGEDRTQSTLFPERLDDYIAQDNPVRAIEAFVEALDLDDLGFKRHQPLALGRPAYDPATLLNLYIYCYLNRVPSSRRIERETHRNVEVMWLTCRLMPDHKTISDFRKDNGKAITGACRAFVGVCRRLELFSQAVVVIDGSKFKAVNNRDMNFTEAKMKTRQSRLEKSIARYFSELDKADQAQVALAQAKLAVEPANHLIVAHEVTNEGVDRHQLYAMADKARAATGIEPLEVVSDRGYYTGTQIVACEDAGIRTIVPKPLTSGSKKKGLFTKQDFVYEPEQDRYRCPAGQHLTWRFDTVERGLNIHVYFASTPTCRSCLNKAHCTNAPLRRIRRWEREDVLDEMQARLEQAPQKMQMRGETVEHPFGTLKAWMGATHFLTKTLPKVRTEMSLQVLAYNMLRVMNILGVGAFIEAMRA